MEKLFDGETAVVTGGTKGIGRATALQFAKEGANVIVADVIDAPREGEEPTHELIDRRHQVDATFCECDVRDPEDLQRAIAAADPMGGIDIMVNNAGVIKQQDFVDVTREDYDEVMDVNAAGVFFGAQAAARRMIEGDGGTIINISSISGLAGIRNQITYCASKGAVKLMTYAMADELRPHDIRVNALHPGTVETDILDGVLEEGEKPYPVGTPEDIAECVTFLASDRAEFVNGSSFLVDGGRINIYDR